MRERKSVALLLSSAFLSAPSVAFNFGSAFLGTRTATRLAVRPRASLLVRPTASLNDNAALEGRRVRAAGLPEPGPAFLVEERDACGVGFIANPGARRDHAVVELGLNALGCMEHRGACLADNVSGDGSGIMTAIPWELMEREFAAAAGVSAETLPPRKLRGLGMVFLPRDAAKAARCREVLLEEFGRSGLTFHGWRPVPVDSAALGPQAAANQPQIEQFLVSAAGKEGDDLERTLYLLRRVAAKRLLVEGLDWRQDMYICSVSCRTIVYKGMTNANALGKFYRDLRDPMYSSNFCVYHRRFSTNTMPRWPLAQPMRMLGHNGEINTLLGNINWVRAREGSLKTECRFDPEADLHDFINECDIQGDESFEALVSRGKSDSANLDSVFELLVQSGKWPTEALMTLIPEAYRGSPELANKPDVTAFYRYWEGMQEAWDGPALIVWSDGKKVGACLDRNGLRPARYLVTTSGMVCMMSETGVVPVPDNEVAERGRLGPGQMIAYDLEKSKFFHNSDIKRLVSARRPYGEWLKQHERNLDPLPFDDVPTMSEQELVRNQLAFGWSSEDVDMQLADMASTGKESTFCMGDDIPLAVLSERPHVLYDYFKQRFAQVTNPAIDSLREGAVMSVETSLGARGNVMQPAAEDARLLHIKSPVLNGPEMEAMRTASGFKVATLSTLYPLSAGPGALADAVAALATAAVAAVTTGGANIVVLSDRVAPGPSDAAPAVSNVEAAAAAGGLPEESLYVPPLLAVGAVHHALIEAGSRMRASLVVETAQAWSTHHFACLVGYGASAVHPYLAFEGIKAWWGAKRTRKLMEDGRMKRITAAEAQDNFRHAIDAGVLKIMSKMGISLLGSYQGAQIFEAIGVGADLLQLGFRGTPSRLGGLALKDLASETAEFHASAFADDASKLINYGYVQFYRSGEYHHNSPLLMKELHKALREKEFDLYRLYMQSLRSRPLTALRDLLDFESDRESIPLEEVEPVESIVARFCTGGMSLGALSREAHETLAIGVNRVGGKSNSGEGGEDPVRFVPISDVDGDGNSLTFPHLKGLRNGDSPASAIKQVASGRFGVTPEYLLNARQIEIKVAQGAKPGEGGQLPGPKIDAYIAGLRASKPGVTLISPPPHHDIYSIEDLAQLIFDLHQVNPEAGVSVKLVSEVGIGTIAAGVAKANADIIQVSGHDGGTGASPLSSIKHAGSPWELGLAEVHRTLLQNSLRDRVLLRVDGGLKTGWDILVAALMGAEEYGFGTVAMIAEGCIMARICHTNNCPVGITTQREDLRKKFPGTPDNVATFFLFVAEEARLLMARLGYRSLSELIGRADLLKVRGDVNLRKTPGAMLDLDFITKLPDVSGTANAAAGAGGSGSLGRAWLDHGGVHTNGPVLDDAILKDPEVASAVAGPGRVAKTFDIVNTDRAVCGRVAGALAKRWGNGGFARGGGRLDLTFRGSAGQSFGSFLLPGMRVRLQGEANDYLAKSIHGGEIAVVPPADAKYVAADAVLVGNTCLYGATGGAVFVNGRAGERFAVRNSAARAVVEGTGDHCCEYMTGGVVAVLGPVGRNAGAGMTGGIAYFLDEELAPAAGEPASAPFAARVNTEIVKVQRIDTPQGEAQLKSLLEEHVEATGSAKAKQILASWSEYLPRFWQLVPPAEANTPVASAQAAAEAAVAATASSGSSGPALAGAGAKGPGSRAAQ